MQNTEFIESTQLKNLSNIKHAFFTKNLIGSSSKYFIRYDTDNPEEIENNKKIAAEKINSNFNKLIILHQVHSNKVLVINDSNIPNELEYDAIVTNLPNIVLGIRTADCVPILFCDPTRNIIAAAHAGWRGAFSGIIQNTIKEMEKLGADAKNIFASIGPCIRQKSYEIDENFYKQFLEQSPENNIFFKGSIKQGHYMFDLPAYTKLQLKNSGIENIEDCNIDSYTDHNFFSYRRAKSSGNNLEGEILSTITLI